MIGLAEIHKSGIIHADLKLDNLLLHREEGKDPIVKICDFGIAQIINVIDEDGNAKALMKERSGSGMYIAPEIKGNNKLVGPEIDMWAFGIILYEMCVAYKPTQVKNYKYGSGPIPFRLTDWRKRSEKGKPI